MDVYIVDDDHYDTQHMETAATLLRNRGLEVMTMVSFGEMKDLLKSGELDTQAVWVMDSSLERYDCPRVSFLQTIPWLVVQAGVGPEKIMPASSGPRGYETNHELFGNLVRTNYHHEPTVGQMGLEFGGFAALGPERLVDRVGAYVEELRLNRGEGAGFLR